MYSRNIVILKKHYNCLQDLLVLKRTIAEELVSRFACYKILTSVALAGQNSARVLGWKAD